MSARGIPGLQITIVRHKKIVFAGAYGHANLESKAPVTESTIFPVNSISKAFAGVAAMQLVEAGKLELDAPLSVHLEELPPSWQKITVRQLLTHVSGLPEIVDDNLRPIDGAEPGAAWAKVQELPVLFSPGAKFAYTQTNYVALGKIIEKITGKSYSSFVMDAQFISTGMKDTHFADTSDAKAPSLPNRARLYSYLTLLIKGMKTIGVERSDTPFLRIEPWAEHILPAGGIQSTGSDLAKWVLAVQEHKLVNQNSLAQLWKPHALNDGTYRGFTSAMNAYGLGWPLIRRPAHPVIGPIGGERAAIFIYPEDDLTVIVLTNLMGASPQKFIDKMAAVYIDGLAIRP